MDRDFGRALARCLGQIPRGRVATCGAIARALGDSRAARAIAMWMKEHPEMPGAHRAVRADGRPNLRSAVDRLTKEGVRISRNRVAPSMILDSLRPIGFLHELREEQRRLATQVKERDDSTSIRHVAGVDVSYGDDSMYAAAVSMDIEDLEPVETAGVSGRVEFPYIPTYLAYREFPGIEAAVNRLSRRPDLLLIDGHGRLHPVLFGVACYAGLVLDIPTIGIGKHPLAGRVGSPARGKSNARTVRLGDRIHGYAWIPPGRSRAIYVSVGHRISLETAMRIVRETTRTGYPEPLRIADRLSREMKRNEKREKGATR